MTNGISRADRMKSQQPRPSAPLFAGQLPPHDREQELRALGRALHSFDAIDDMPNLRGEMFYFQDLGTAFDEMRSWRASGNAFDPHYLLRHLEKRYPRDPGVWDKLLADAVESVPHGALSAYDAQLVQESWTRRQAIYVATDLIRSAHEAIDFTGDLATHQAALQRLSEAGEGSEGVSIQSGLLNLVQRWEAGEDSGLATGFSAFDQLVRLMPEGVYVVAGRPGEGKSALALSIAEFVSRTSGVLVFSLEMSRSLVLSRLVSHVIEIPAKRLAELVNENKPPAKLSDVLADLSQRTFIIDDRDHLTVDQMAATARAQAAKHKLALIVIDYCQLITPRDRRVSREQQVAEISRSIKQLAKQVRLPILLLSQMSRAVESRDGRWPQLSDLRESGAIENDADAVIFVHNESPGSETYKRLLVVRKNRTGGECFVPIEWQPQFTKFKPASPTWQDADSYNPSG